MSEARKGPPYVPPPPSPEARIGLLKARIRFFRKAGLTDYVATMEAELAAFAESDPEWKLGLDDRA